ncbi:MAG: aryl-sulfate sulfotransferase [Thermoleophilia bacterium]|nr:aryl-sulfate sulfotransferase [Thermoleophilia bacterium]
MSRPALSCNGNLYLPAYKPRAHVDLSAYGGSPDATVIDAEIQEIDPEGNAVWSWNSKDHTGLDETGRWYSIPVGNTDLVHINSIDVDGDSLVVSFRHADAVYKINRTTGDIEWKLGGTPTPESLTVVDDPYAGTGYPLGGQHDARVLADGTVTVHDNGSGLERPPRAVRYEIDEAAHTATLVESVSDPEITSSACCGSVRRSPSGSWLMSWGGNSRVTEFNSDGDRTFRLSFGALLFSYRAFPVPQGQISRQSMREAMETMHPR